ncbi:CapA family protein [Streptomyces sp. NPDC050625]|uniref:CapA family protein n=1 Tax=Streptomyces sp. NPDC050625 TaxID=3154629 RepID=UPI0034249341
MTRSIEIVAVGDVAINRPDPLSALALVRPIFQAADVTFANCESTYAKNWTANPAARGVVRSDPEQLEGVAWAGVDVVSFANNHHLDAGYDGFHETLEHHAAHGIAVCGAGKDLAAARTPAVIERDGVKTAFLAYSSILWPGYEAGRGKPGCAPIFVDTHYEMEEPEQPGCHARVSTYVRAETLKMLREDVEAAREVADVVVVSAHWGIHFTPVEISDYESEFGRAAIDAGADLVLGTHQHILKAVEVYRGKAIFHGTGNFVMDVDLQPYKDSEGVKKMQEHFGDFGLKYYEDYPLYPFHPDARNTVIVRAVVEDGAVKRVSMVPCLINGDGQPAPLDPSDPRFADVCNYQIEVTKAAGFGTSFDVAGGELVVSLG